MHNQILRFDKENRGKFFEIEFNCVWINVENGDI